MSAELNLIIKKNEIILNGVRYIPDFTMPNKISIYLMKDNHSTIRIYGTTVKQILTEIKKKKLSDPDADTGTVFLMHDQKEIKREQFEVSNLDKLKEFLESELVHGLIHDNVKE